MPRSIAILNPAALLNGGVAVYSSAVKALTLSAVALATLTDGIATNAANVASNTTAISVNTTAISDLNESFINHTSNNLNPHGATSGNTAQRIVSRDVNGDFAARIITATTFSGNLSGSATLSGTPTAPTASAATNTTQIATTAFVQSALSTAVSGLLNLKGSIDASANPNYLAATKGDSYIITVSGKVGGASGKAVDIGDMVIATATNAGGTEASVGASWSVLEHNLSGALVAANNLSDVTSVATARTNLSVYSIATMDTALALKATIASPTFTGTATFSSVSIPSLASAGFGFTNFILSDDLGNLTSVSTLGFASITLANTFTNTQQISSTLLGTTPTDVLKLVNTTAATSGVTVQYSGAIDWEGSAWKSTAVAVAQSHKWRAFVVPVTGTSSTSSNWQLWSSNAGGAYVKQLDVSTAGALTVTAGIGATTGTFSSSISATTGTFSSSISATVLARGSATAGLSIRTDNLTVAGAAVTMVSGTLSGASLAQRAVEITPTYNQTGTGAGTDLLINRTETAIGSGSHLLIDAQRASTSQFNVDRVGKGYFLTSIGIGIAASASNQLSIRADCTLSSLNDGQIIIYGSTTTNQRLQIGVDTSTSPMTSFIQSSEVAGAYRPLTLNPFGGSVHVGALPPSYARGTFTVATAADYTNSLSWALNMVNSGNTAKFGGMGYDTALLGGNGACFWQGFFAGSSDNIPLVLAPINGSVYVGKDGTSNLYVKHDTEVTTVGSGFVLKSPNGTRYRIAVSNVGVVTAAAA